MERQMVLIDKETLDDLKEMVDFKTKLLEATLSVAEQLEQDNDRLRERVMELEMVLDELIDDVMEEESEEEAVKEPEPVCTCMLCEITNELQEKLAKQLADKNVKRDMALEKFLNNF